MDSLPTGSDTLLDIRTRNIDFVIKAKGKQTSKKIVGGVQFSSLKIVGRDIDYISVPVQNVAEKYTEHLGNAVHELTLAPLFFEQTDYILTVKARDGQKIEFQSNSALISEKIGRVIDDDPALLSGVINFGNNVGFTDFFVTADGKMFSE